MTDDAGRGWALALLAALAACLLLTAAAGDAHGAVQVSKNKRINSEPFPVRGKDVPTVAVNPRNPRHLVEVQADWLKGECEYTVSLNGGRTWSRNKEFNAPPPFPKGACTVGNHLANDMDQPGVAFGSGNNVYAVFGSNRETGAPRGEPSPGQDPETESNSVLVAKSRNGGRTFGTARVVLSGAFSCACVGPDYSLPTVAVDRRRGRPDRVYISADEEWPGRARVEPGKSVLNTVVVVSRNGGRTFSQRVQANAENEDAVEASNPVIGRGGDVYVAWRNQLRDARGEFVPEGFVVVGKSTDGGKTWTQTRTAPVRAFTFTGPPSPPHGQTGRFYTESSFPKMAADPRSGNVYVVYNNGPDPPARQTSARPRARTADHFINPDVDVWFQRSTNGGQNWSSPRQINDPLPPTQADRLNQTRHPYISVAPNGRVDVTWHDRRHWYRGCVHSHLPCEEAKLGDTYYSYSRNGGASFSRDLRITDRHMSNDVGYDYRFGTYWTYGPSSVAIGNDKLMVVWPESREGNYENDTQDNYSAIVDLRAKRRVPVERISGGGGLPDFSVRLSRRTYTGGGESVMGGNFVSRPFTRVVIVNERDVAGALAGGVLARANVGPVLVSPAGGLPASVKAEIGRLTPVGAYVVGGEGSLSNQVVSDLQSAGVPPEEIRRLDGGDAAGTSRLIARTLDRRSNQFGRGDRVASTTTDAPTFDAVIIANPESPDAVAAAALAASRRLPFLFTSGGNVPQETRDLLAELNVRQTLVVGGTGSVSDAAVAGLPGVTRVGGGNVYETSRAVVTESRRRGEPVNIVYVSNGARRMDAAVAGQAIARRGGLQLLTRGGQAVDERELRRIGLSRVDREVVLGGLRGG